MVKADAKRNYYADLEVSANADTDEIKKSFRKLARLYHPDRNPGKELEYVPKFQSIQAAHEILSDPEHRAKYDLERRKLGFGAGSGLRSTPGQTNFARSPYATYSDFAPPPRRTARPQPNPTQPAYSNPPYYNHQGRRAANFATQSKPPPPKVPPRAPPRAKDDADARANVFTAWQHMQGARAQQQREEQTFSEDDAARRGRAARDAAHAHTQKPGLGRSNTTKTPRKSGFDPNSTDEGGWEPQAKRTSAYSHAQSPREDEPQAQHNTSSPSAGAQRATPRPKPGLMKDFWSAKLGEDAPFSEGNARTSTPYASNGGEKTYFDADSLRRSASTHITTNSGHQKDGTPRKKTSPLGGDARPRSASPSARTTGYQKPSRFNFADDSINAKGSFKFGDDTSSGDSGSSSPKSSPSGPQGPSQRSKAQPGKFWAGGDTPLKDGADGMQTAPETPINGAAGSPPIFTIPRTQENPNVTQKSRSSDDVSTAFSADTWAGKFEGSKDFVPPTSSTRKGSKPRIIPSMRTAQGTTSRQQSFGTQNNPIDLSNAPNNPIDLSTTNGFSIPPPPPNPPATGAPFAKTQSTGPTSDQAGPVKFSSEEWENTFKEQKFFYPDSSRSTSPTKQAPASVRRTKVGRERKQSRSGPRPYAASVGDASDEKDAAFSKPDGVSEPIIGDDDAMEIDSESPITNSASKGPRLVPVPPMRPDWREGVSTGAMRPAVPTPDGQVPPGTVPTAVPNASFPKPPPPPKGKKMRGPPGGMNLNDLKNVTPLAPAAEGLQGMKDLSGTLPFESHPSAHPVKTFQPQQLELPAPPKAPAIIPANVRITQDQWRAYVGAMSFYMGTWYQFNDRMLKHFNTRHANASKFGTGQASTNATRLLEAMGESSAEEGLASYITGLEEDVRVRRHWDVACDKHREAVEGFAAVKARVGREGLVRA